MLLAICFPESGVINVSLALKNSQVATNLLMSKHRAFRLSHRIASGVG